MAKVNINGMVFEGTNDELVELFSKLGAKIPAVEDAEESLKVGDYVKFVSPVDEHKAGDIRKIDQIDEDDDDLPLGFEGGGWAHYKYLAKATDEEVAEAKRKQAEKAIEAKWASINRKPNEFKKGDIVEITEYECGLYVGTIAEVREPLKDAVGVNGILDGEMCKGYGASHHAIKLITPVEARFDLSSEGDL